MAYVELCARVAVALVFIVSVLSKLSSPASFTGYVNAVRALGGERLKPPAVWGAVVVAAEVSVATTLLLPGQLRLRSVGFLAAAALLSLFSFAIVAAVRRGLQQPCRCFGPSSRPVGATNLLRNGLLLVLCLAGLASGTHGEPSAVGAEIAAALGVVVAAMTLVLDTLVDLWRPAPASATGSSGARR